MPTSGWWSFFYALEVAAVTVFVCAVAGTPPWWTAIPVVVIGVVGRQRHRNT